MNRPRKKDGHLPSCVHFKHGAHYYIKGGKWTRLPKKGPSTLSAALEAYAELVETPRGGMNTLIDEALDDMRTRLKKNTIDQYEIAAKKLKAMLAEFAPDQVRGKHVAGIKRGLKKTPNMANRVLSFGRQVFDYALEEEMEGIESNPFVGVRRHKEKKRERLLTPDEQAAIYAKSGPRLQVIEDLLRITGQRITAVLQIKRTDLGSEGIRFPHHKTEAKRIVKWNPELRAVVDRAKALRGNVQSFTWLLPGRLDRPPDYRSVKLQWDKACKRAGVEDAHLHDNRAVAATEAERQGKDATKLLAHTSPQQTRRYLRGKEEVLVDGPSIRQSNRQPENS